MKKTAFAIMAAAMIFAACSSGNSKESEAAVKEAEQMETVTTKMDSTITDIEHTATKLDTLLKELEN